MTYANQDDDNVVHEGTTCVTCLLFVVDESLCFHSDGHSPLVFDCSNSPPGFTTLSRFSGNASLTKQASKVAHTKVCCGCCFVRHAKSLD